MSVDERNVILKVYKKQFSDDEDTPLFSVFLRLFSLCLTITVCELQRRCAEKKIFMKVQ